MHGNQHCVALKSHLH